MVHSWFSNRPRRSECLELVQSIHAEVAGLIVFVTLRAGFDRVGAQQWLPCRPYGACALLFVGGASRTNNRIDITNADLSFIAHNRVRQCAGAPEFHVKGEYCARGGGIHLPSAFPPPPHPPDPLWTLLAPLESPWAPPGSSLGTPRLPPLGTPWANLGFYSGPQHLPRGS